MINTSGFTAAFQGQTCDGDINFDQTDCWPPTAPGVRATPAPLGARGFYSPGLVCPAGYASTCGGTAGRGDTAWAFNFRLTAGETAVGCCPTGYACAADAPHGALQSCLRRPTSGEPVLTATCRDGQVASLRSAAPDGVISLWAPLFQLNFRAEDVASTRPAPATSVAATPGGDVPAGSPSGLSHSTVVAVAVVVPVSVIAILAGIAAFVWRHRHRRRRRLERESPGIARDDTTCIERHMSAG